MLSKNLLKEIRILHIGKYRRKEQKFIAEGPKIVQEFLDSQYEVDSIYATADWMSANQLAHDNMVQITEKELQAISLLKTPNQVLAIVNYPMTNEIQFENGDLIIALDTIQDPGNLGTIIRIADWFGIRKIVCSVETADAFNPKVVQASMGALTRVQMIYTNLEQWLKSLDKKTTIYGTMLNGENIYESELKHDGVIVIGNEGQGISSEIQQLITSQIKIPAYSDSLMESLNAAVATAIVCAEFRRRKP